MKINTHNSGKRRPLMYLLGVTLILLVALGVYFYKKNSTQYIRDGINYSPPTQADKELNDRIKQDLVANKTSESNENEQETDKRSVRPIVTAWGQPDGPGTDFKLNGYVPKIIEPDGRCTITMTKDGLTVAESKHALQNAQNTSCGQLVVSSDKLEPGTWAVQLSYTSNSSAGVSKTINVEVK